MNPTTKINSPNRVSLSDKVKSIREQIGGQYRKPSRETLDLYINALQMDEKATEYLEKDRGLSKETIKHFMLGYDVGRNAIAIPVFKRGELVNIKYRLLDPEAKARYTSERGAETWIFNEDGIQRGISKSGILIVEGEFDCMTAWQAGILNVVSPASGKDSYGVWIEYLDNIAKIYIAYDNDSAGKETSIKLAERLGTEKCLEVNYPEGIKDTNEYFKKHTKEEFLNLIKSARPFYTHQFKGIGDIVKGLRENKDDTVSLVYMPKVKLEKDWMIMVSGQSNVGKTSYVLNLVDELTNRGIPTLVFPFERGIESVGRRFLQVKFDMTLDDFSRQNEEEWGKMIEKCIDTPAYFAMPKKEEMVDTIIKSKRIFDTRVVVIDHLDYIIRHVSGNKEAEIGNTLQDLKRIAEEYKIILLIVSHTRKIESAGGWKVKKKPGMEDLKGSSSLYQDPEVVVMLSSEEVGTINVDVLKNKGEMGGGLYKFNVTTGKINGVVDDF